MLSESYGFELRSSAHSALLFLRFAVFDLSSKLQNVFLKYDMAPEQSVQEKLVT